jgi:gluconokinase
MHSFAIGVDIGTGSTKAVAMDVAGNVVATAQAFYATDSPQQGYSEQDPAVIWESFLQCIQTIQTKITGVPLVISLSSCMHSLLVVGENNKLLTPLITWADTRSEREAEAVRSSKQGEQIYKSSGTPVHSMSPLCKILWLRKNNPELFQSAQKFISIKEYIWYRLFRAYQIDHSIASATGLFCIEDKTWNSEALQLCGITDGQLSEIVPTNYLRTDLDKSNAELLRLPAGTPFCIGASDGCLANLGSFAVAPGIAALTIGTSGAVRIAHSAPIYNYTAMIFNYILDEETFICGGPVNNGGNVVQWLLYNFLKIVCPGKEDYNHLFTAIDDVPAGSNGLLCLPYLHGERAPIWDEKACGVYFGIRAGHTQSYFMRAALEGVCYALTNVLEKVEETTGAVQQLNVSGGFIHSKTWMQLLADVTGKKLCLLQTEDASAVGAALLALKSIGEIEDYNSVNQTTPQIIEPHAAAHAVHQKNYNIYKSLYPALKDIMHLPYTHNH